jgi:hypothetical protein
VASDISKLLQHIARHYTGPEEAKDVERDAPTHSGVDLEDDRRKAMQGEQQRASELDQAFRDGLARAASAVRAGGNAVVLDDRNPEDNRIADAMVHFLVGPGIATTRTRETGPLHYTYTIWIDWDRLDEIAREANVKLDEALRQLR